MKVQKHHYSNFLISVPFDKGFMPDTVAGMKERCENFLDDLGDLARKNGKRLHSTFSGVSGVKDPHAHFAVSWLPLLRGHKKTAKRGNKRIDRNPVIELLEHNFFFVDNYIEAIKRVTHDKKCVTEYVIHQPKDGQTTLFDGFYIHPDFVPVYSEVKIHSYCSKQQMHFSKRTLKRTKKSIHKMIVLISILEIALISIILLSIF